jgi:hypothetical protein
MENTNMIYGLRDPRNDVYRYIGKTTVGKGRPLSHLNRSHNKSVNMWVSELNELLMEPYVDIIESDIPLNDLAERERYYITYYSDLCGSLLNCGTNSFETINAPAKLSIEDIRSAHKSLVNIKDVYRIFKINSGFSDEAIANAIGISRPTLCKLKKYTPTLSIESYAKMVFFSSIGISGVFNYYYSLSNEYKGKYPDTINEFIERCINDSNFCRQWFSRCYEDLFVKDV